MPVPLGLVPFVIVVALYRAVHVQPRQRTFPLAGTGTARKSTQNTPKLSGSYRSTGPLAHSLTHSPSRD